MAKEARGRERLGVGDDAHRRRRAPVQLGEREACPRAVPRVGGDERVDDGEFGGIGERRGQAAPIEVGADKVERQHVRPRHVDALVLRRRVAAEHERTLEQDGEDDGLGHGAHVVAQAASAAAVEENATLAAQALVLPRVVLDEVSRRRACSRRQAPGGQPRSPLPSSEQGAAGVGRQRGRGGATMASLHTMHALDGLRAEAAVRGGWHHAHSGSASRRHAGTQGRSFQVYVET